MCVRRHGRRTNLGEARIGARVGDVLGDAGRKQNRLLQDDRELVSQIRDAVFPQVCAVEENPPRGRVEEAGEETHERRLAGAGHARDAGSDAGRELE